jgi:hypothetical protein
MENSRFDRLTRQLASADSRRSVLKGLIGSGAIAALPISSVRAQDATPGVATPESDQPEWLLVVSFNDAEIVGSTDDPSAMAVTLTGVNTVVTAFTDRPERQTAILSPEEVTSSINAASDDPLNAALVARLPLTVETTQMVVLLNAASYDADAETLILQVKSLDEENLGTPVALESGQSIRLRGGSLFIDGVLEEFLKGGGSCLPQREKCATIGPKCCPGTRCIKSNYQIYGVCL